MIEADKLAGGYDPYQRHGDPQIQLSRHIYVDSKASWEVLPEGVVTYKEGVPNND